MNLIQRFYFFISRRNNLSPIEKRLGYTFKNKTYLNQALTHKSINTKPSLNYERLEFLGDAVLDIIVSKKLLQEFPEGDEGLLTQKRAALVQKYYLAQMGKSLNLIDYLIIDPSVTIKVDKVAMKQLANIFESLLGALFLDGGLEPCESLIMKTVWTHRISAWKTTNYKGRLIEYCHSNDLETPTFKVKDISGPDHLRTFEILVKIGEKTFKSSIDTNKKSAEQGAAKEALEELKANI